LDNLDFLYNDNNFNSYQKGQLLFIFNKLITIYVLEKLQYLILIISFINLVNLSNNKNMNKYVFLYV